MSWNPQEQLSRVAVVASETARLADVFRSWPEAYWQRPTYCPGWQVADAVAHLATGGDFYAQVIASGRSGEPKLPWGASDAAGARAGRAAAGTQLIQGGPAALIAGFEQGSAKLQRELETLEPNELSRVAWHPRGLVPLGNWIGMRLNELVIHDWDMRQPHEPDAGLSPTALPAMLAVLPELQLQFLARRLETGPDGVHVLQAGETSWAFTVREKTVTCQAPAAAYDTCLRAAAEDLILLTMGRADATAQQQSGRLTLSGDTDKAQQLCAVLFRTF
jgi:uncharacterized protein (TIGR03083 family)